METFLIVKKRRTGRHAKKIGKEADDPNAGRRAITRRTGGICLPTSLESWIEEETDDDERLKSSQNGIVEAGMVISAVGRPSMEGLTASSITDEDVNQPVSSSECWSPEIPFENVRRAGPAE